MSKLIILCGIPGSGKSTWAKNYKKEHPDENVIVVSSDGIRLEVTGSTDDFRSEWEVWNKYDDELRRASLQKDAIIIADSTHLSEFRRLRTVESAVGASEVKLIHFKTPFKTCVARRQYIPDESMKHYRNKMERISEKELKNISTYKEVTT